MPRFGKWETIDERGSGGQGVVYLARNTELLDIDKIKKSVRDAHLNLLPTLLEASQLLWAEKLAGAINEFGRSKETVYCGALKVLHSASTPSTLTKQMDRMEREIEAMETLSHPNIIRILDHKLEDRWLVTEFFDGGTLADHLGLWKGDFCAALESFRPLVEAVAEMHGKGLIHRDIKPENIFVGGSKLVLGDLGLVYFADEKRSRISDTLENVGSRDWMPAWAMGMRLEDIRPSFDVFSLGKLLWSMISGKLRLQLWYLHQPQFELEVMFEKSTDVRWARQILDRCIVEEEADCLPSAKELLELIDVVLPAVRRHSQVVSKVVQRVCRVCGVGNYVELAGQMLALQQTFQIFTCDRCRHTEFFRI